MSNPNQPSVAAASAQKPTTKTVAAARKKAQKWLNDFIRFVVLAERLGNAFGLLAFTWATVVVLGGFSAELHNDFWYAAAIVFLEAFRTFCRESRSDDQLLFRTAWSIKPKRVALGSRSLFYVNALMIMGSFSTVLFFVQSCLFPATTELMNEVSGYIYIWIIQLTLMMIATMLNLPGFIEHISRPGSPRLVRFIPAAAYLLVEGAPLAYGFGTRKDITLLPYAATECLVLITQWFILDFLARAQLPRAGRRVVKVARPVLFLTILYTLHWSSDIGGSVVLLASLVLGNLQIPAALARIAISCPALFSEHSDHHHTKNKHLEQALKTLYIMVLCQGTVYAAACILESLLSSFLRRSLALRCGLVDESGIKSLGLYYEHAYDTCMQGSVLGCAEEMSLVRFAIDSLNTISISHDKRLAAVRILHSLLQQEPGNTELLSEITTSTPAVTALVSMLGLTFPEDADTRLLATKVVAHLAPYVRIVRVPGTIEMVCSLLDAETHLVRPDISSEVIDDDHNIIHGGLSSISVDLEATIHQVSSTQVARDTDGISWIGRVWQHIKELRSLPHKGFKDEDSLPVLGMLILEGLAHDVNNCKEISRAEELLPKTIGLMSYITDTTTPRQKHITTSSLMLVAKIASIKGKIGVILRQELSENVFLFSNLTDILESSFSSPEQWKQAIDIIAKLAIDESSRQEIGRIQVVISKLMQLFLWRDKSSNVCYDGSLRTAAGEALAILAMNNAANCSAILDEQGYDLIEDLKNMLLDDEYVYLAASVLDSVCANSREKLRHQSHRKHLSLALPVVWNRLKGAEGKQLEALTRLASQICNVIPNSSSRCLDSRLHDSVLAQKLVNELRRANKKPNPDFPNLRRVLVELTLSIVQTCPHYAAIFRAHGMMEALSEVEKTPSKMEKYTMFSGGVGVVLDRGAPLLDLVTKVKEVIDAAIPGLS